MTSHSFRPTPVANLATACFSVQAAADPGVMPRVLEVFAKRGIVPATWYSAVTGPREDELHIDVQVRNMDHSRQTVLADSLRQIVGVSVVLTAEKRQAASA